VIWVTPYRSQVAVPSAVCAVFPITPRANCRPALEDFALVFPSPVTHQQILSLGRAVRSHLTERAQCESIK